MFGTAYTGAIMAGVDDVQNNSNLLGMIPRTLWEIFDMIEKAREMAIPGEAFSLSFSFLEVYNDHIFDLLSETARPLAIREDEKRGIIQIPGLSENVVHSTEHVLELVAKGQKLRKTEPTDANTVSSRSHAVLQLILRHIQRSSTGFECLVESKLSMIDLAGSERASATNNRGIRLQEGGNINKSLLALGNAMSALAENAMLSASQRKINLVKYRDSKLTHLLKTSLEGNTNLVMIANVNPSDICYEDSLHTLSYANRAKQIKVNPLIKEKILESTSLEREARLTEENLLLRKRILELEGLLDAAATREEELRASLAAMVEEKEQSKRKSRFSLGLRLGLGGSSDASSAQQEPSPSRLSVGRPSAGSTASADSAAAGHQHRPISPKASFTVDKTLKSRDSFSGPFDDKIPLEGERIAEIAVDQLLSTEEDDTNDAGVQQSEISIGIPEGRDGDNGDNDDNDDNDDNEDEGKANNDREAPGAHEVAPSAAAGKYSPPPSYNASAAPNKKEVAVTETDKDKKDKKDKKKKNGSAFSCFLCGGSAADDVV